MDLLKVLKGVSQDSTEYFDVKVDVAKKTKECTCWAGYERVAGTKPCAPNSCAKKKKPK